MDVETLIEMSARERRFPIHRTTYAQVLAELPITKAEAVDALHHIRSGKAAPAEVRTTMRRLMRALPHAGLHLGQRVWKMAPEAIWRSAIRTERGVRTFRLSRAETVEAALLVMASGPWEYSLRNRLWWSSTQGAVIQPWSLHDLEGEAEEVAECLFQRHARYLERLAAPEMDEPELTALVARHLDKASEDSKWWEEDYELDVFGEQLPNAGNEEVWSFIQQGWSAARIVAVSLERRRPDPDCRSIS